MRCRKARIAVSLAAIIAAVSVIPVVTQDEEPGPHVLKAGVIEAPPFTAESRQGTWEGLSIELSQRIVGELGMHTAALTGACVGHGSQYLNRCAKG
jgi:hypothetical protein